MALETSLEKVESSSDRFDQDEDSDDVLAIDTLVKVLLTAKIGMCAICLEGDSNVTPFVRFNQSCLAIKPEDHLSSSSPSFLLSIRYWTSYKTL
jgi:hypothetical protein